MQLQHDFSSPLIFQPLPCLYSLKHSSSHTHPILVIIPTNSFTPGHLVSSVLQKNSTRVQEIQQGCWKPAYAASIWESSTGSILSDVWIFMNECDSSKQVTLIDLYVL